MYAVFRFIITPSTDFGSTHLCLILRVQVCLLLGAYHLSPLGAEGKKIKGKVVSVLTMKAYKGEKRCNFTLS